MDPQSLSKFLFIKNCTTTATTDSPLTLHTKIPHYLVHKSTGNASKRMQPRDMHLTRTMQTSHSTVFTVIIQVPWVYTTYFHDVRIHVICNVVPLPDLWNNVVFLVRIWQHVVLYEPERRVSQPLEWQKIWNRFCFSLINPSVGTKINCHTVTNNNTGNLAIADKPHDMFRGQSRSPNMVPFNKWGMVSYECAIVTLSIRGFFLDIRLQKCSDLENRVKGQWRSLKISPFNRQPKTSYWCSIVSILRYSMSKNNATLKSQSRSLKVVSFDRHWV